MSKSKETYDALSAEEKGADETQICVELAPREITTMSLRFGHKETSIAWRSLGKTVTDDATKEKKVLLSEINGVVQPGELVAVMGPSGSGKTTLLDILGGRGQVGLTGTFYLNGRPSSKTLRRTIAYVLQDDIFYEQLTVRQQV